MDRKFLTVFICLMIGCLTAMAQPRTAGKTTVAAEPVGPLGPALDNSSSLFFWGGELWTLNDHGSVVMYSLDTLTGATLRQLPEEAVLPLFSDMEETAQDEQYLYMGDFGNNHEHLRDDLRILRIGKDDFLAGRYQFDTIWFAYDGYDPSAPGSQGMPVTEYDCEAMAAAGDSLYLFTKQWSSYRTTCYALPKSPGRYTARRCGELDVNGLVTGACLQMERRLLVLCGYNILCQPFVYILKGFEGTDFFGGSGERVDLDNGIGIQTEAIATRDGLRYYLTNETFNRLGQNHPAQLLRLDLTDYLGGYLHPDTATQGIATPPGELQRYAVYPNPASDCVTVRCQQTQRSGEVRMTLYDTAGREVLYGKLRNGTESETLLLGTVPAGEYLLVITAADGYVERHTIVKL